MPEWRRWLIRPLPYGRVRNDDRYESRGRDRSFTRQAARPRGHRGRHDGAFDGDRPSCVSQGPARQPGRVHRYVGIPLFGACTLLALWRAFTAHGPVVTIAPQGIWDRRVAAEIIPWSAVKDIAVWKHRRQRYMVLMVDPAVEAGLHLTRMARWSRNANRALGADGLCVGSNDLKIGFDRLLSTSLAFARASPSSRAPVAQTEAAAGDGR